MTPELQAILVYSHLSKIGMAETAKLTGLSVEKIEDYSNNLSFLEAVARAKKDMAASVVDRIRDRLHTYITEMEGLALGSGDPRVRFQALKDLLDRGGMAATQKMSLTSPSAYRKAVEEFMDVKEDNPHPDPESNGAGVQPAVPESNK